MNKWNGIDQVWDDSIKAINEASENYIIMNTLQPKLMILPFKDFYHLHLYTQYIMSDRSVVVNPILTPHFFMGMVVDYDYDATEIIIKGFPNG